MTTNQIKTQTTTGCTTENPFSPQRLVPILDSSRLETIEAADASQAFVSPELPRAIRTLERLLDWLLPREEMPSRTSLRVVRRLPKSVNGATAPTSLAEAQSMVGEFLGWLMLDNLALYVIITFDVVVKEDAYCIIDDDGWEHFSDEYAPQHLLTARVVSVAQVLEVARLRRGYGHSNDVRFVVMTAS